MSDPTPIQLPDGANWYRVNDLPDEGWEASTPRPLSGWWGWQAPNTFKRGVIVAARRQRWVPKVGDRVESTYGERGEVLAVYEPSSLAWVLVDGAGFPYVTHFNVLSPEQAS